MNMGNECNSQNATEGLCTSTCREREGRKDEGDKSGREQRAMPKGSKGGGEEEALQKVTKDARAREQ